MIDFFGWIGSFMFAMCALPQAIKTLKTEKVDDISSLFVAMWFTGEVSMITYILFTSRDPIFMFNYFGNLCCLMPVVYYKIKGFLA